MALCYVTKLHILEQPLIVTRLDNASAIIMMFNHAVRWMDRFGRELVIYFNKSVLKKREIFFFLFFMYLKNLTLVSLIFSCTS